MFGDCHMTHLFQPHALRRCRTTAVLASLLVTVLVAQAAAEWVVGEHDRCVKQWTPRNLWRGAQSLLDAPLVPVRWVAGAIVEARECPAPECSTAKKVALGGAGTLIALTFGSFSAFMDATLGFADLVTFGLADWSLDDATRFTLQPIRFEALGHECCFFGRPIDSDHDPCGRLLEQGHRTAPRRRWYEIIDSHNSEVLRTWTRYEPMRRLRVRDLGSRTDSERVQIVERSAGHSMPLGWLGFGKE